MGEDEAMCECSGFSYVMLVGGVLYLIHVLFVQEPDGWAGHVGKVCLSGHLRCHTGGEGANLFMDVSHEGVGRPASMLFDGDAVNAIEFHGHGSSSSEGVAADIVLGVAISVQM